MSSPGRWARVVKDVDTDSDTRIGAVECPYKCPVIHLEESTWAGDGASPGRSTVRVSSRVVGFDVLDFGVLTSSHAHDDDICFPWAGLTTTEGKR